MDQETDFQSKDSTWKSLYKIGAVTALFVVLVGLIEIGITFLPGGERVVPDSVTVVDWFTMYQNNWFLGLRNLGLLNIFITALGIPTFFALYGVHRHGFRHPQLSP